MFKYSQVLEFQRELENIKEIPIVVEGKKDEVPLTRLGCKKVFMISGSSPYILVEKLKKNNVNRIIILTDYDNEGEIKARKLRKIFQMNNIKVDDLARNKIKSILKINKIEEISSLIKLMEDDSHGKITSIYGKIFNRSRIYMRRNCRKTRCNRSNIRTNRRFTRCGS
jgi:5S rRNA maturation endonuclease (ribonuclease M5)